MIVQQYIYNNSSNKQIQSMQEDPYEMIRYFSDFLTQINLIISNIKQSVYEIIDVNLNLQKGRIIQKSMSSVILGTHKTFDDLKKIQSILGGVVKSKRIIGHQYSSYSFKKRSKTSYTRFDTQPQRNLEDIKDEKASQQTGTNCGKTIKRKMTNKIEINEQLQLSGSSQGEVKKATNKNVNNICDGTKKFIQRGMQHSSSELAKSNNQQRILTISKQNKLSLQKIMQTNNDCLRLVRSARKNLKHKKQIIRK